MTIAKPVFFNELGQMSSMQNALGENEMGFRRNTNGNFDTLNGASFYGSTMKQLLPSSMMNYSIWNKPPKKYHKWIKDNMSHDYIIKFP